MSYHGGSVGKESACNAGDAGLTPGLGRCPGGGHGNPLQYSCVENPMDGGAWRAQWSPWGHSQTWLSNWTQQSTMRGHQSFFKEGSIFLKMSWPKRDSHIGENQEIRYVLVLSGYWTDPVALLCWLMNQSEAKILSLHLWSSFLRMKTKILYVTNSLLSRLCDFYFVSNSFVERKSLKYLNWNNAYWKGIFSGLAKLESWLWRL